LCLVCAYSAPTFPNPINKNLDIALFHSDYKNTQNRGRDKTKIPPIAWRDSIFK